MGYLDAIKTNKQIEVMYTHTQIYRYIDLNMIDEADIHTFYIFICVIFLSLL